MNFLTTLFFVILTSGIHHVHADWPEDRERLVIHFGTFIQSLQDIAIQVRQRNPQKVAEIQRENPAGLYTLTEENSTQLLYIQEDLNGFLNYTMQRIQYLTKTQTMSAKQMKSNEYILKPTIRKLCDDINLDPELGWEYKYDKLPLKEELKQIFLHKFDGNYEEFMNACPDNPRPHEPQRPNPYVDKWGFPR